MSRRLGIGLIGLGSIGQRMLRNAGLHEHVRPAAGWDPDPAKVEAARAIWPDLACLTSARDVIERGDVNVVYVASPPRTHAEHAHAALEHAKPVLCEKPLGVDLEASRELVAHAARSRVANAVNFIHASGAASDLKAAIDAGALGAVHGAELRIHARQWAERRYAEAPWLSEAAQGGLVREVISHFVFLSERLFGAARVRYAHVERVAQAMAAETGLIAHLECAATPLAIVATTRGEGPDAFEYTVWGERASRRIRDLYVLEEGHRDGWRTRVEVGTDPAAAWFRAQLDNVARWAAGAPHTLPDFAAALSVQRTVETMLRAGAQAA